MLRGYSEGVKVFDCFAGTGSIGLETLSLGATKCVFVERDKKIIEILQRNIDHVGVGDRAEIVRGDALGPMSLARCPDECGLIFMDPPYALVREPDGWERVRAQATKLAQRLSPEGWMVVRTPWPFYFKPEVRVPDEDATAKVIDIDLDKPGADDALEAFEAEIAAAAERVKPIDADLTLAGALGPETHDYGSTAIHLYQRDTGPDDTAQPDADAGEAEGGERDDDRPNGNAG